MRWAHATYRNTSSPKNPSRGSPQRDPKEETNDLTAKGKTFVQSGRISRSKNMTLKSENIEGLLVIDSFSKGRKLQIVVLGPEGAELKDIKRNIKGGRIALGGAAAARFFSRNARTRRDRSEPPF